MSFRDMPAQLFPAEKTLLFKLASEMVVKFGPEIRIVNIGVKKGGSLHCLRAGAPEATLFGIDIDLEAIPLVGDPRAILIEGNSNDPNVQGQVKFPIHLLFVDGSHERIEVAGDIVGWTPKIIEGGIVAFHDYWDRRRWTGVSEAVNSWKGKPSWKRKWRWRNPLRTRLSTVFERL